MLSQAVLKPHEKGKKALHEKVAIVTGSTYGIGFAIARRLAQDGAHVLLCSRKRENVERACAQLKEEGLSISAIQCHVGNKEDRERLVETAVQIYGKIDILICNAAVNPFVGPIFDTTKEMWKKGPFTQDGIFRNSVAEYVVLELRTKIHRLTFDGELLVFHVNVISTFLLIKLVAPHIQKQGEGSIIICSSFMGYIPHPLLGPYSITKTTLLGLTNIMAQALRPMNIRVNGLALGLINTSFSNVIQKIPELASKLHPLGVFRVGQPEECAGIASFLCSEDASYINGENVAVTGGVRGRL